MTAWGHLTAASGAAGEEFLHLGEEGFGIGIAALRRFRFEGAQQFLLLLGELDRGLDAHFDEEIAVMAARLQQRHAAPAQLELMAGLRAFRNIDGGAPSRQCRHFDLAAEGCLDEADRHAEIKVLGIALKDRVLLNGKENIQIARRSAIQSGLAFAGQADARSLFHTGRDIDRECTLLLHMARAVAGFAGIFDHAALTTAFGTSPFDGEETLARAPLAMAGTSGAAVALGAGLRAAAAAMLAGDGRRHTDLCALALIGVLERDLHIVAQIAAAVLPLAAAPAAAHELAEQIIEHIGERGGEIESLRTASAEPVLEGGMPEAFIGGTLVRVLQDLIGFADFLELVLCRMIAGIAIGMAFHRQLAIGAFQFLGCAAVRDPEDLVIITLTHTTRPPAVRTSDIESRTSNRSMIAR